MKDLFYTVYFSVFTRFMLFAAILFLLWMPYMIIEANEQQSVYEEKYSSYTLSHCLKDKSSITEDENEIRIICIKEKENDDVG